MDRFIEKAVEDRSTIVAKVINMIIMQKVLEKLLLSLFQCLKQ